MAELEASWGKTAANEKRSGRRALRPHDAHLERAVHARRRRDRGHQSVGNSILPRTKRLCRRNGLLHRSLCGRAFGLAFERDAAPLFHVQHVPRCSKKREMRPLPEWAAPQFSADLMGGACPKLLSYMAWQTCRIP